MAGRLEEEVRRRAGDRCEYCHVPDSTAKLRHVLDHIIAKQHGGQTSLENMALSCGRCNQSKGPNIAGIDPESGAVTPLFNPRVQQWPDHFAREDAILIGTTAIGRVTVAVLSINAPLRVAARRSLIEEGHLF